MIQPVTVTACAEDGTGDTVIFNELLQALTPALSEMDSYRYRTLYRYTEGGRYVDDDLSVELEGVHTGLLAAPVEGIFPITSQSYDRSDVILTDLRSGSRTETIVTEDGFWVLGPDEPGWVAFNPATPADFTNLAEMFSPLGILFTIGGGGSLIAGVQAESPAMMYAEILDGREVTHRCWILPAYEDNDFNAVLIHWENTYTFLSEAEVHLWTTKDDEQLVQLVLTAKHSEERQGLSEYADEDIYVQHDPPRDFLLWMEITDVDAPIEIEPPPLDQVMLTIPLAEKPATDIAAPYNDLPLPTGAERVGVFGGDLEKWPPERLTTTPREFRWLDISLLYGFYGYESVLDHYFGLGWDQIPADRRPVYEAEIELNEAIGFYLEEMGHRGWLLGEKFLLQGAPMLYLFFEREGVIVPVILETRKPGTTSISAILPPSDDVLETILSGWTTYTTRNSDLSSDSIQTIAFDPQGRALIGTYEGINVLDDEEWTSYTAEDMGLAAEGFGSAVNTMVIDGQGRVWVGTYEGLAVFDGKVWKTYNTENSELPGDSITALAIDKSGRVLIGLGESISVFDGRRFTNYASEEIGLPDGHMVKAIATDPQGRVWLGTSGGGVYLFDGEAWNTALKAKSPPNTSYTNYAIRDIAIDSEGRVWIGTQEGLSVFNGEEWIDYIPENSGMPFQWVEALAVDAHGRVWVGGLYGALSVLETDGTWNTYTPIQDAAASFSMNALVVDPSGRIWVGADEGLNIFTPPEPTSLAARELPDPTPLPPRPTPMPAAGEGFSTYTTKNSSLVSNVVNALAIDGQDRVWVGTSRGVSVLSPSGEWTSYQIANSGLLDDRINALAIDGQDRVWMGTGYGVAVLASDGTWKTYYTRDDTGLSNQTIEDLLVDSQDRVWTAKGCYDSCDALSVLGSDGKWTTYNTKNSDLANDMIHGLAMDKQGRVWMTTYDGVSVLAPNNQWTNYTKADLGLTNDDVWLSDLDVDEQGRVWIGSYSPWTGSYGYGIIMLAPNGSSTVYTIDNPDPTSNDILALLIDEEGRVWAGTGVGLSVLSPDGRWESYTYENSDIPEGAINSLAMDNSGRLWIGTDAGLGVFVQKAP